jgi:hypothetical protein
LSRSVPVVHQFDAFALDWNDRRRQRAFVVGGADQHVVRVKRPGAVVFGAVQPVTVAIGRQGGGRDDVANLRTFQFRGRKTDDGAVDNVLPPFPALIVLRRANEAFDHAEMVAEDMRDVRIRRRQPDHDGEQLADRTSSTAIDARNPQCAQPGTPDQIDRLIGKDAVALPFDLALGDVIEQPLEVR